MKIVLTAPEADPADPRLQAAAPGVQWVAVPDAAAMRREGVDAEVCYGSRYLDELMAVGQQIRWVASEFAGADSLLRSLSGRPEVVLTNAVGCYGIAIAEHVMALLLAVRRELGRCVRRQVEHVWERRTGLRELHGTTLGIVGFGNIGQEVARIAHQGFGMRVVAHKRRPVAPPETVAQLYYDRAGLLEMLAGCDQVVVAAALTAGTRHLLDAEALDVLPAHAVIVNIGRGALIDEAALVERLADGRLAGAGLDVMEREPLPPESPLWDLPNVVLTSHNAGLTDRIADRRLEFFIAQLRRYLAGEPLEQIVDRAAGY